MDVHNGDRAGIGQPAQSRRFGLYRAGRVRPLDDHGLPAVQADFGKRTGQPALAAHRTAGDPGRSRAGTGVAVLCGKGADVHGHQPRSAPA